MALMANFETQLETDAARGMETVNVETVNGEPGNPFDFFDAIYCINLDRKTERWEKCRKRFQALGIGERVRRFSALDTPHNQHIGCALSHRAIIAEAQRSGLRNVLVFEDDVQFAGDTLEVLAGALEELRSWPWWMLFLGGCTWRQSYPKAPGCEFLEVPRGMTCTHAVAYNHTIYDRILADVPDSPAEVVPWLRAHAAIDQYYASVLAAFQLVTRPVIATQSSILATERRTFEDPYQPRDADWSGYHEWTEACTDSQWQTIQAFLGPEPTPDLTAVLDFACGRGRIAERFAPMAGSLICSDIVPESMAFCRRRFADCPNVQCVVNDAHSIPLPDESLTFVYCWDAMVHFNAAELRKYFREFKRLLRPGGMTLVHHSNYGARGGPPSPWTQNPGGRAYVSASDVEMICDQHGLTVVRQQVIDWSEPSLDCLTLFRKPAKRA